MQVPLTQTICGEQAGGGSEAHEQSSRGPEKSAARAVLVVDDDPLFRWAICETLETAGYAVVEAGDARSALEVFVPGARPVDVVFLDLQLPDSDDLRVLSSLRRLAPSTPVVLMTSFGSPDIVLGACVLGAFAVIDKPFELNIVSALVQRALSVLPH